jgi:hypothetical protein
MDATTAPPADPMKVIETMGIQTEGPQKSWKPFIFTTLALLVGLGALVGSSEREFILANWDNERCTIGPMFFGGLFKPADYPGSAGKFATENFKFCLGALSGVVLKEGSAPVRAALGAQAGSMGAVGQSLQLVRGILTTMVKSFTSVFSGMFDRHNRITTALAIVTQKLRSSMSKLGAVAVAMIYYALTAWQGAINGIRGIMMVALIIMAILVALVFILFFVLWPFIPSIIIPTIVLISSVGIATGAMAASFCFPADTLIVLEDGSKRCISEIQLGDRVEGGGVVEGVYKFNGSRTPLYRLNGVRVSGSHLAAAPGGAWIPVEEHPSARPLLDVEPVLYCLTVSTRVIPCAGAGATVLFRDWEELEADDDAGYNKWEREVYAYLNQKKPEPERHAPNNTGACRATVRVLKRGKGVMPAEYVSIKDVQLGDWVAYGDRWTCVVGTLKESVQFGAGEGLSDGVWLFNVQAVKWEHPSTAPAAAIAQPETGYHLITDAGMFNVYIPSAVQGIAMQPTKYIIRDALEVPLEQLNTMHAIVAERLGTTKNK